MLVPGVLEVLKVLVPKVLVPGVLEVLVPKVLVLKVLAPKVPESLTAHLQHLQH